jgi:hypothetical protein
MIETIKILASTIATGIAIVAYIPYLIDMFRGKNKPHLYTWISYFLITAIVGYFQVIGGAGVGAIPTIMSAVVNVVILFYCFRFGTKDIVFFDKICLALSIIGVISYGILYNMPLVSLIIVTIAEVVSFIPTFRKTLKDPFSESLPSYYLTLVKLSLILIALQQYNLLTILYSVIWFIVFVAFLGITNWLRRGKRLLS